MTIRDSWPRRAAGSGRVRAARILACPVPYADHLGEARHRLDGRCALATDVAAVGLIARDANGLAADVQHQARRAHLLPPQWLTP